MVHHERGSALLITLVVMLAMSVLGVTLLTVSVTDRRIAANEADSARAFFAAEGGLERAIAELPSQNINTLLAARTLYSNVSLATGTTYSTTVANNLTAIGTTPADSGGATNDTDGVLILTSSGAYRNARRTVNVAVRSNGGGMAQAFNYVMFGKTSVTAGGGGQIWGDTGSNGGVTANTTFHGNAIATGTVTNPTNVTGTVTNGAPAITLPDVPCPSIPYGPSPTGPGVTFNSVTGDVDISGNSNSSIAAGTYLFHNFTKCCNGYLNFPAGGVVKIYVSGAFNVNGNGFVNPNGAANFIQVFACGNNATTWNVNGNNDSWFTIYAPRHPIVFAGNGQKNGAYVGLTISKSGNGHVVYDATAQTIAPPAAYAKVARTWREIW